MNKQTNTENCPICGLDKNELQYNSIVDVDVCDDCDEMIKDSRR